MLSDVDEVERRRKRAPEATPPYRQRRRRRPHPSSSFSLFSLSCYGIVCCVIQTVQTQQPLCLKSTTSTFFVRRRGEGAKEPVGARCPVRHRLLGVTFRWSLALAHRRYLLVLRLLAGGGDIDLWGPLLRARTSPACVVQGPSSVTVSSVATFPKPYIDRLCNTSLRKLTPPPPFLLQWLQRWSTRRKIQRKTSPSPPHAASPRIDCCITTNRDGSLV